MPAEDGLRLHQDEGLAPSGPGSREPDPEDAIRGPKRNSPPSALAIEDEQLVAKVRYLGLKGSPGPEERRECGEDGQRGRGHRGISLAHGAEKSHDYGADRIFGRDKPSPSRAPEVSNSTPRAPRLKDAPNRGETLAEP